MAPDLRKTPWGRTVTMTMSLIDDPQEGSSVLVQTMINGDLEVDTDKILDLSGSLIGFEHLRRFVIYQSKPGPMYWLQSIEQREAAFCLLAPFQAGLDPDMAIGPDDVGALGASCLDDIDVYCLVVLNPDPKQVTVNLRAPILVARSTNRGRQLVLDDPALPLRYHLNDLLARGQS